MTERPTIDVGAVLAAAYRRPDVSLDQVASRVRAKMALVETLGECVRLLIEAPGSAVLTSLPSVELENNIEEGQSDESE